MTIAVGIAAGLLGIAALLAVVRMTLGPTILDRVVTLDVIAAVMFGGLAAEAILNRNPHTVPILAVLALVGFIGTTSVARFAPGSRTERRP